MLFDEEVAKQLEVVYHRQDVLRRRRLVREALRAQPGERILDVGCGPGFYLADLLESVGPDGSLVGVDSSPASLAVAARRCEGHPNVTLREGEATALPVEDGTFDAALIVQVLEYVNDATAALAEISRALRPGGRVVVWDIDWSTVSWHSADPARMTGVLQTWDEHLAHPALPRTLASRLRLAGFGQVAFEAYPFASVEFDPERYAAAIMPLIRNFVAGRGRITEEDADAWADEQRELGDRGEYFFCCTQFCFTGTKSP
jgi:arsenite methyltransferase